ncbi:MAG TPA: lysoplasmalogenase [Chitinophagales bacterium]|nr:lysoplasmalogenase [Chitinophagales bacterium]
MIWLLYILLSAVHLSLIYIGKSDWLAITKPLLMPALALVIINQTKLKAPTMRYLAAGVLLGGFGDLFLMGQGTLFFALGLVAFLIGHLLYIYVFAQEVKQSKKTHYLLEATYWILPYTAFFVLTINLLSKYISNFPVFPIYLYAFVIFLMSLMAVNRWYAATSTSWWLVFLGSLLFIISDLALAVKVFIAPFENSSLLIMSTYIAAQGLIVYGCINNPIPKNQKLK